MAAKETPRSQVDDEVTGSKESSRLNENDDPVVDDSIPIVKDEIIPVKKTYDHETPDNEFETPYERYEHYKNIQTWNNVQCPHCYTPNPRDAVYCQSCGKLIREYASTLSRVLAFIIDFICIFLLSIVVAIILAIVVPNSDTTNSDLFAILWLTASFIITLIYFIAFELEGQTTGKMILKIKVVNESDLKTISVSKSIIRNLLFIIDLMPYLVPGMIGVIAMVASEKNQRIGDMASKTIVIKD